MRKFNEQNERIKRQYLSFLKEAKGQDETSLDKVAAALRDFEDALDYRPFKAFHREWAARYKRHLEKQRNARTGKPLGLTTRDSTLRLVKGFFHWLVSQPGYKSRITYADVAYFNNNAKDARAAHQQRPIPYPSLEQCAHAFRSMPDEGEVARRDKAMFALLMLSGARDGAAASLRLKHIDLVEGRIFQDGREVRTKNSKTIETWFFPVDPMYRAAFERWVRHLREDRLFGPGDAIFPKLQMDSHEGRFVCRGLSRDPYANAQPVIALVRKAFREAGLPQYTPHSFRKTLAMLGDKACVSMEQRKAWSQNLGHEHLATTISAYMPVPRERQAELLRALAGC
jgi:integrase/recombinase XerD